MTQVTATDEIVDSPVTGQESSPEPPSQAGSRDEIGAALLRLSEPPERVNGNGHGDTAPPASHSDQPSPEADASTAGDTAESDDPLPRRGSATIRELKAEVEALKQRLETPAQAQPPPPPFETPEPPEDPLGAVRTLRGDDAEYRRMHQELIDGGLSFEDTERYRRMTVAREFEQEWHEVGRKAATQDFTEYRNGFFSRIGEQYSKLAGKPGIDAEYVQTHPDMGDIFEHVYQAGRSELTTENERLKAQVKELKAQALGRAPQPARGGRTTLGLSDRPDPRTAGPQEMLQAGIRQRDGAKR